MSKKANPALVGTFVLAAIALTVAAIIMLGNIKFKDNKFRCVAYFTGSLYGLDIGASVTFRGVAIGRVSKIAINFDSQQNNYIIPVYIDIEQTPDLGDQQALSWNPKNIQQRIEQLISQGMRAQLKISSLLTSKLYVDLAFSPDTEAHLHGKDGKLCEIPTLPSGLEQITQKLVSLPLSEILNKTATALDGINSIINSAETRHSLQSLDTTLARLDTLLGRADTELPGLTAELKKGLANFSTLTTTANSILRTTDKELPSMSRDFHQLLTSLNGTAIALTKTLKNIELLTEKDSTLAFQVANSLQEIEKAASSLRQLTEYLQQYPNALVFGQGKDKP